MKKILFFLESLGGGGAEKVLTDLVNNLDKNTYDVTVCTVIDGGVYQTAVEKNCQYFSFLKKEDYEAGGIRKLRHWIDMKKIYSEDVSKTYRKYIHDEYDIEIAFIEGFATKLIASSPNKNSKKICWVHIDMISNDYADKFFASIESEKKTYEKYDQILAVSDTVKESMEKKFGIKDVKVQYNPVDSKQIVEQAEKTVNFLDSDTQRVRMVTVGRLEPQKGYDRLLRVINRLKEEGICGALTIVGAGSMRDELEDYVMQHELDRIVNMVGFQENPYPYIKNADAFICSSFAEGFSTVATESLILGTPVFTTDCSGMKELFGNEACGEIVPNTEEALYDMLKKLLSGQYDFNRLNNNAKKRAADFDISIRMKEVESLL